MHSGRGCRVGEVQAGTTSPMPDHKGFELQQLVNFQKFSTLRVNLVSINIGAYIIRRARTHPMYIVAVGKSNCNDSASI